MLLNEKIQYTDKEIMDKGAKALINELGYSGFLRFIKQFESINGEDYLTIQDEIYKDMSVDEIFEKASEKWNKST
jgi:hypothetical protein